MGRITFDFTDENFIVTGGSSGIGRQIAIELATANANVLTIARRANLLEELHGKNPRRIKIAAADLNDKEKTAFAIEDFVVTHGKINGFVHAAGIGGFTPLKNYDEDFAKQIFQTSFWDGVRIIKQLHRKKYSNDGASIVLFSSTAAFWGQPGMFAYSAAKAAVNSAVKTLAKELSGRKIRINTVCPGRVQTKMTDEYINKEIVNRHLLGEGASEDISGIVLFLLSDRARWITGTNVIADGGFTVN